VVSYNYAVPKPVRMIAHDDKCAMTWQLAIFSRHGTILELKRFNCFSELIWFPSVRADLAETAIEIGHTEKVFDTPFER